MLDYLSRNYESLALIGIIILIFGVPIGIGARAAGGRGIAAAEESVSESIRILAIIGSEAHISGIGVIPFSLTGAIIDEERNQYAV